MKSALLLSLIAAGHLTAAPVPAKKAEDFVHSIGVNLHMGYDNPGNGSRKSASATTGMGYTAPKAWAG